MRQPRFAQYGFTLIEIVSVLVILGVLAAVAVPKYFDLQEESEKKAALSSVAEAQARIQLRFGQLILQGNTCEKAVLEVNTLNKIADSTADGGNLFGEFFLSSETITTAGVTVKAKRKGNTGDATDTGAKLYVPDCTGGSTGNGMGAGNAYFDFAPALVDALTGATWNDKNGGTMENNTIQSTAPNTDGSRLKALTEYFQANGITPGLSDIKSWAYSGKDNNTDGIMYWSKVDINENISENQKKYSVGDQVLSIQYNKTTKKYSVGYVTIQQNNTSASSSSGVTKYNAFFGSESKSTFSSSASDLTFESAMEKYNTLSDTQVIKKP